jgi:hypothetical protein
MQSKRTIGHKGKHSTKGEDIKKTISTIMHIVIISSMIVNSPIVEKKYFVIMTNHSSEGSHPKDL